MDDRTEPFSIKIFHIVQPNDGRGHEQPPDRHIDRFDNAPAHALAIGHQLVISDLINHRTYVSFRLSWIAHDPRLPGTRHYVPRNFRHPLLDTHQPKRRQTTS